MVDERAVLLANAVAGSTYFAPRRRRAVEQILRHQPAARPPGGSANGVEHARCRRVAAGQEQRLHLARFGRIDGLVERDDLALEVLQHLLDAAAVRALLGRIVNFDRLDRVAAAVLRVGVVLADHRHRARAPAAPRGDSPLKYLAEQVRFLAGQERRQHRRRRPPASCATRVGEVVPAVAADGLGHGDRLELAVVLRTSGRMMRSPALT